MGTLWTKPRAAILVMALVVPTAYAGQQLGDPAIAKVPSPQAPSVSSPDSGHFGDANAEPPDLQPDMPSLAGARDLSLGSPVLSSRGFWQPFFSVTSTLDTNPLAANRLSSLTNWSSVYAGIDLRRISRRSDLTFSYVGGALISNDGKANSSSIQQLQLGETLSAHRTTLSVFDQFSYLPETAFGFTLPEELVVPGDLGLSLASVLVPSQSILTTRGERLSNSSVAELDTFRTSRSSLTLVGSYSLLRFFSKGFLNFTDTVAQAGWNREITGKDTIALLYRFNWFRFENFNQSINDHTVGLSYGRRLTGRLAFQVVAGPEVAFMHTPIAVSTGSASTSSSSRASWSLNSSMFYQAQRAQVELTYDHMLSGGAGVLAGAVTDQVSGSISRRLTGRLSGQFQAGYARNKGVNATTSRPANQSFDYWFGGVNFRRFVGRTTELLLSYQAQYQDSNTGFCVGLTCGRSIVRHTVSLGFDWRPRPMPIE